MPTGTQNPDTVPSVKHSASFKTTQWTMVIDAGKQGETQQKALAELCASYWYPLYAYVRREGYGEEDAKDLTQGFFEVLLTREDLRSVNPKKGRFRSYLLAGLKNHLRGEHRKRKAAKRGSGAVALSLDDEDWEGRYQAEPSHDVTPEYLYHRSWAVSLLARTLKSLEAEYVQRGRGEVFTALKPALSYGAKAGDHKKAGALLGMTAEAMGIALHRMRQRYGQVLRSEVQATVGKDDDVDAELHYLLGVLAR